jgi:lipopolysaccharide export system permease protein
MTMRILDRQRYWAFLKAYVICFVSLVGLYVVLDAFSNLDEHAQVTNGTLDLLQHMGRYYLVRMSRFYDQLCGVISMMAAIFTVTWMQRNNELIAMLAAGISTQRAIRPVLISAVLVSSLSVLNQEWIIPPLGEELQQPPDDDGKQEIRGYSRFDINEIRIHGVHGFRDTQTLEPFDADLPVSRFGTLINVEAKEARYFSESDVSVPYRKGWLLRGTRLTPAGFDPDDERFAATKDLLIHLTAEDLKDYPPPRHPENVAGDAYFLRSNVSFTIATRSLQWYQFASTPDLIRTINEPIGNTEKIEISVFLHTRLIRPFATLVLMMLSLPLVLGGDGRNMFINLGLSLATSGIFYAVAFMVQYLGANRVISPELAAWIPIFAFGTLAVSRWDRIRT